MGCPELATQADLEQLTRIVGKLVECIQGQNRRIAALEQASACARLDRIRDRIDDLERRVSSQHRESEIRREFRLHDAANA